MIRPRAARGWRPSSAMRAAMSTVKFGIRRQHPPHPGEVLGEASDVHADERRGGVGRHDRLQRPDDPIERGEASRSPNHQSGCAASSSSRSLQRSSGSKNATGSATWISSRHAEVPGGVPHRREPRVVGQQQLTIASRRSQPEVLPHLHAQGAGFRRRGGFRRRCVRPIRRPTAPTSRDGRTSRTGRMRPVVAIQVLLELVAPAPVEVHDRLDVAGVHHVEKLPDVGARPGSARARPPAQMVVRVDRREPGTPDLVRRDAQGGPGPVVRERKPGRGGVDHDLTPGHGRSSRHRHPAAPPNRGPPVPRRPSAPPG